MIKYGKALLYQRTDYPNDNYILWQTTLNVVTKEIGSYFEVLVNIERSEMGDTSSGAYTPATLTVENFYRVHVMESLDTVINKYKQNDETVSWIVPLEEV